MMSVLPKAIYRFHGIPIKIPMAYFTDLGQIFQKLYMEPQKTPCSLINLEKEYKVGRDHNTYIKTVWYWHKYVHIDQWNRIENPETNPSFSGQLIFDKGGMNTQWSKGGLFNEWGWENWTAHMQ